MLRRLSCALGLATGLVALAFAGPALAGGNSVHLTVPKHARLGVSYSIELHGYAVGRERLYLFLDYHGCAANPAIEHGRANGDIWIVRGSFTEVASGWESHLRGVDHACAFLQHASKPKNSSGGLLARAARSYRIH